MATIYIDGVKAGRMAIGTTEIANILKGTSDPSSSIGGNGQLYLKYADLSLREYIEVGNTAGPYINTGFYWSSDCEFEIKAKWTGTPTNNTAFFGAYSPNMDTDVQVYNGNTLFYVGGGGTASLSVDTNDHIYKATQSELLLDGTNVATPNWSRVPTSLEVSIFTMQQHSPAINARIYYIKIWKSGELHKYFIPAINNATNEIGMFEAVSGEFYSNDGTGNFDISPSVISDMPSRPILSSFAKVNGQWQNLIGTDVDAIQSGEGPRIYTNSKYYIGQEQITDISGFTKLYSTDRNIAYGSTGEKVNTALGLTDESTITSKMNEGWQSSASCYYDSENHVGAYGGYNFGEELFIGKTKFWLGRYSEQNKTLTATIQYLDSNGDWHDVATVDITTDLPYPLNIFEVNINNYVYGVRWIHKTVNKTGGNNICFFGMTLYEGSGEYINVYAPESGLNEVPEGYDGFGPILV